MSGAENAEPGARTDAQGENGTEQDVISALSAKHRPYADSNARAVRLWKLYIGSVERRLSNYKTNLLQILEKHGVKTVLDAACGIGTDSIMLIEEGYKVNTIDLEEAFLQQAREVKEKRINEAGFSDWNIGYGDWVDLHKSNGTVPHPPAGYDAIICIGNSFGVLPDFEKNSTTHLRALGNFRDLLKPGGVLVIDHRNCDYVVEHGKLPPNAHSHYDSKSNLYYNCDRVFNMRPILVEDNGLIFDTYKFDVDVTDTEFESDPDMVLKERNGSMVPSIPMDSTRMYPHSLTSFTKLLQKVFGEDAKRTVLPDFKESANTNFAPNYWVHVVEKGEMENGKCN